MQAELPSVQLASATICVHCEHRSGFAWRRPHQAFGIANQHGDDVNAAQQRAFGPAEPRLSGLKLGVQLLQALGSAYAIFVHWTPALHLRAHCTLPGSLLDSNECKVCSLIVCPTWWACTLHSDSRVVLNYHLEIARPPERTSTDLKASNVAGVAMLPSKLLPGAGVMLWVGRQRARAAER